MFLLVLESDIGLQLCSATVLPMIQAGHTKKNPTVWLYASAATRKKRCCGKMPLHLINRLVTDSTWQSAGQNIGLMRLIKKCKQEFSSSWDGRWATVGIIYMGQKGSGGCCAPFAGELGPRLTQCGLGRGLLPCKVASSSIHPFGYNRHEPKTGGCAPFIGTAANPSNTTSPGPSFTSVLSGMSILPAVFPNRHGPKIKLGGCAFFWGGTMSPSNTKSLGPRPTSILNGILMHAAVWP